MRGPVVLPDVRFRLHQLDDSRRFARAVQHEIAAEEVAGDLNRRPQIELAGQGG
jgi:hypothetical protein